MYLRIFLLCLLSHFVITFQVDCKKLLIGQFICPDPNRTNQIDPTTQQFYGCNEKNKADVWCIAADGITCDFTQNASFTKEQSCEWT